MNGEEKWKPRASPWLIAAAVMLATFMEVLDTSIANVALPHIAGTLSATPDEATWVLTSYLISNAIVLPATHWLGSVFGRKCFLIWCIGLFTVASALCGLATNLGFLIVARVLQGAGGGALQPVSQAILLESFPPHRRGVAMATFAMGVVVAPILGPIVGGWITDHASWRWIFYINLPIGIPAIMLSLNAIEDPPYLERVSFRSIDSIGLALMAVWLATLQFVLDKGQEEDWLASGAIRYTLILSVIAFIGFIVRELTARAPLVDLSVLKNRNFGLGVLLITVLGAVLYGTTAVLPLFMQTLLGYSAFQAGLAMSPRGAAAFVTTILVGRLAGRVLSNRVLIAIGFVILAVASYMLGGINAQVPMSLLVKLSVINGIGISLIFVPLTTSTMGTLSQREIGNASGIYNLMRNLGGSVGIAGVTTLVARGAQVQQAFLTGHVSPLNPAFQQQLAQLKAMFAEKLGSAAAERAAEALIARTVSLQASVMSYVTTFRLIALICLVSVPLIFLLRKVKHTGPIAAH